jgi:DNA-binding beta-propeller fold protein YncE
MFNLPEGIAVDQAGNVYVADSGNRRVRKITPAGQVTTIAGYTDDGLPVNAGLWRPKSVAVDDAGNVYIGDWINARVRKLTPDGEITTLIANYNDAGRPTGFATPSDIVADGRGGIYVADPGTHLVHQIGPDGTLLRYAGSGLAESRDGAAGVASLDRPYSLALDGQGELYVFDEGLIRKVTRR